MKKILYIVFVVGLGSCKPEIKGELGEPFSKVDGINGSWQLTTFSQRDENNPIKEVRDLSEYYIIDGQESTKLTFNSSDFTYSVEPGPGRNFFGTEGTWRFDNNEAPAYVFLEMPTDTLQLTLGSMPRSIDTQLNLELPRYCVDANSNAVPTVTYIFNIQRTN